MRIEALIRQAIRDAVNRNSRKPFYWGGLMGYQQLEAIAQALHQVTEPGEESGYLRQLVRRVDIVLAKNRSVAEDLLAAHRCLRQIAACLRYPPEPCEEKDHSPVSELSSHQVDQEMQSLVHQFHSTGNQQLAQRSLFSALRKRWDLYAQELLFCYDIPHLPQDNLQIEAMFGRLRRHQRRISGRKSTRELRDFGQAQVLFRADCEADLLHQIRQVPWATYRQYRQLLAEAEAPRQFFRSLHHDPLGTAQTLISQHAVRCNSLAQNNLLADKSVQNDLHIG